MRPFHAHFWRIILFLAVVLAAAAIASSARAAGGGHGGGHGGGMGGFHGGGSFHGGSGFHGGSSFHGGGFHGGGFHGGHFRSAGCCFFGFGFGGWPFWPFSYGYGPSYPGYFGGAYPYYPPAYYPPYPPVAATPPAAPGVYTGPSMPPSGPVSFAIYFATGSDRLNTAAHNIITQAAAAEAHSNAQIAVAGFTDATGNSARNLDLSRRRAESVRDALIQAGVPEHRIALVWHGEEGLQVPTASGVAQAENRRVVIVVGAPPPSIS